MTLGDVATKARSLTHTDIISYTDAQLLIDINIWNSKVSSIIFESQDDSDFDDARNTTYPIVTTPMVAGQRDYAIPVASQVLKIKRVDITYDGTNYYRATPFDAGAVDWGMGNSTNEDINMIKQAPRYDIQYNAVFVYPLPVAADVTAGAKIRIEWFRDMIAFVPGDYTTVLTDSTVIPGFDRPFHPILAYGAAYEFARAQLLPQMKDFKEETDLWEARIRVAYGRKNQDTQLFFKPAFDNYGDYGGFGGGGYTYR